MSDHKVLCKALASGDGGPACFVFPDAYITTGAVTGERCFPV